MHRAALVLKSGDAVKSHVHSAYINHDNVESQIERFYEHIMCFKWFWAPADICWREPSHLNVDALAERRSLHDGTQ
jgi:hypothetical protein